MKKYFVFSDIHGSLTPLLVGLEKAGFDIDNESHILISLGDHFDRGIENLKVLGFIKYFDRMNRLIMIKGNHDEYLRRFLLGIDDGIMNIQFNGMGNTVIELADSSANSMEKIRRSILKRHPYTLDLLQKMVDQYVLGKYIFTHAGLEYNKEKGWHVYNFARTIYFVENFDPKDNYYVFGHIHAEILNKYFYNKESHEPFRYKNFIGIDTKTIISKKVNVLVFDENGNEITNQ